MIPFASQRGFGQDLATHLLNAHDNELVELAEMRGAIAPDMHGAFAEWEAQAHALTKCKNYLYSLSVNPDPKQDPLTREQYFDYINRVENELGLTDQPRAVVFHIKYGREHCHVAWSRINSDEEKAVQLSFDREKLMMVTREFARDHSLELPDGYYKGKEGKNNQLSLYEMHQKRMSGLSKGDHQEQVTDAWRASDSPKAFIQALAEKGYMLATGNRPYVLVDFYGNMNSLPKLINDKTIQTKDIRAFLKNDFPPESLPSVDEAKSLVNEHRKSVEGHLKSEQCAEAIEQLKHSQDVRRKDIEKERAVLRQKQHKKRLDLTAKHKEIRGYQRNAFLMQSRQVRKERQDRKPTGLAGFLGRVSGVELLRKKIQKYQDKKQHEAFRDDRERLKQKQGQQRNELKRRHEMQSLDLQRKQRALEKIEKREMKSLEEALKKEIRIKQRGGREEMPSLAPDIKNEKEKLRRKARGMQEEFERAASGREEEKEIDLTKDFTKAARDDQTERKDQGSGEMIKPASEKKIRSYRRKRNRDRDNDRGR